MSTLASLQAHSDAVAALAADVGRHVVAVTSPGVRISGIAVAADLVVTAEEVLPVEGEIRVFQDGTEFAAEVAGRDPSTDIAFLKVPGARFAPAKMEATSAAVGAVVLVAGAKPAGPLVACGSVAHSGPAWDSLRGGHIDARIELDLRLPREAEGGLVADASGRPLGMAVFAPRRRAIVIPAATIARITALHLRHGHIPRGYLGLSMQPVALDQGGSGLLAISVEAGGPADKAGLRQGDIITAFEGAEPGLRGLSRALGPESVGEIRKVTLMRGGTGIELSLEVGDRPAG